MKKIVFLLIAAAMAAATLPAAAQQSSPMPMSNGMKMMMPEAPATFAPTRQAYTTNHDFLVKLVSVPSPIPFEQYFALKFAVYDAANPSVALGNASFQMYAGMRHGLKHGFAHGMQSSPQIANKNGLITVSGMYFHMNGPWTIKTTVSSGGKQGVAYFQLPCCAH